MLQGMTMTKRITMPDDDPNAAARAAVDRATGTMAEPTKLPAHVSVVIQCAQCGATFKLSRRDGERDAEMRAFSAIHAHVGASPATAKVAPPDAAAVAPRGRKPSPPPPGRL